MSTDILNIVSSKKKPQYQIYLKIATPSSLEIWSTNVNNLSINNLNYFTKLIILILT